MVKDLRYYLEENQRLEQEKMALNSKLSEAEDIIKAIKEGNLDAVLIAQNETLKVLVSPSADQTYRKFIENMIEGIITLNTEGVIVYSNLSFAKIFDIPLKKVIGKHFHNFIPDENLKTVERFFSEDNAGNSKVELSILNNKGENIYFTVSLKKLQLDDFLATTLVWTDVTDQKKVQENLIILNENLQKANDARKLSESLVNKLNKELKKNIKILESTNIELSTFAHVASHDLQEPLRKIITYGSTLLRDYYYIIDSQGQHYLNSMQNASKRMINLIKDILEYSSLSKDKISYSSISLQQIVEEAFANLEIGIKNTKAKITIEKELPVIQANASQMRQLFENLLSNALKFRKPEAIPEISIGYEYIKGNEIEENLENLPDVDFCKIYIKDNGIGFSPEYRHKIFAIFQRLNSNAMYPGTGIGLSICKKIVESHNGIITAESKPDEGTTFAIALPVRQKTGDEE